MGKIVLGAIGGNIFGHLTWISALVNFVWLLVKDQTLFSWWFPIGFGIATLVSIVLALWGIVTRY